MGTQVNSADDDIPAEIDFSKGTRGKFFKPSARLHLPVYLDDQVQDKLDAIAKAKGVELSVLVNEMLRREIEGISTRP